MSRPALPAQPLRDRWRVLLCAVLIGYAMFLSSAQRLQATEPSQQLTTPGVTGTDDSTWRGAASVLLADGLAPFLDVPGTSVTYPTGAAHGPYGVAVSPDGKHVYVSDYGNDRLIVFARDTATGSITVQQPVINGSGGVSGVDGPYLVTVSPDGKNVYVTGSVTDTVVSFARNQDDGSLTYLSKLTRNDPYGFCNPTCPFALDALDGAYQVAISPDGKYGYVSSILDNRILVLNRDATTGALVLNPLSGPVQIFSANAADLSQAYGIALSPDGAHLYLTGYGSDTLLVLARDADNGTLTQVEVHKQGQAGIDGLNGVFRVATSPDGKHVYTASFDGNALTAFQRDTASGKLTFLTTYVDGVDGLDGLGFATSVAVTPDGARVIATGFNDDAITVFDRNPTTGLLVQSQVVKRDATTQLPALDGARDVAISPDGRSVYATGFNDNQVVALQASNPLPQLSSLAPDTALVGSDALTLVIQGANFLSTSLVRWNGADLQTTFVDSTQLEAEISAAALAQAGTAQVTVFNPEPGGGVSNPVTFTIENPLPQLSSLAPDIVPAGSDALTLVLQGANFLSTSLVRWNGADLQTTFVDSTRLEAEIAATALAQAGTAQVTVFNPGPGGGVSNPAIFTIENPLPTLLSATLVQHSNGSATLVVDGSGFVSGATAQWNGVDHPTAVLSSTRLTISLTASELVATSSVLTVTNPAPGGGVSNTLLVRFWRAFLPLMRQ